MQIKNISTNTWRIAWFILRTFLVAGCIYFIYDKVQSREIAYETIKWPEGLLSVLVILFGLMIVNWSLEAYRWKLSLSPYEEVSFLKAANIILAGLSMSWVMPFTTGEALARLVPMRDKYQTTSAMMLNRVIMMCLTMIYGAYAVWVYSKEIVSINWIFTLIIALMGLSGYLFRKRLSKFFDYFKLLSLKTGLSIVGISILRYAVFVFQFYLLLSLFLPLVPGLMIFAGTGWIFLARSVLPTFMGGFGIREASGVVFFSSMVGDVMMVVVPIFILWITNTVLPSIIGLLSIWKLKPYKSTSINIAQ